MKIKNKKAVVIVILTIVIVLIISLVYKFNSASYKFERLLEKSGYTITPDDIQSLTELEPLYKIDSCVDYQNKEYLVKISKDVTFVATGERSIMYLITLKENSDQIILVKESEIKKCE